MSAVLYNVAEGVCTTVLNRPEVLNVLNVDFIHGLDEAVLRAPS